MALPSPAIDLAEEIRSLIQGDDLPRAAKRLLDYTKQFSGQREFINSAIVLTGELRSLQREIRKLGDTPERSSQLTALRHRILEIVDEVEASLEGLPLVERPEPPRSQTVLPTKGGEEALPNFEQARRIFVEGRAKVTSPPTAALEARGLRKAYRGGFALSNIDLTLRPGEITGLVGVNASGKTTLLRILAGELAADGGDLAYPLLCPEGLDWVHIRSQIAYVQQHPSDWYGILEENLYLHAAFHQLTGRANEDAVEFILHRLGLETYRKASWYEISGGFQMRFELAKALVGQPKLLILDEPLAPLDINTQQVFLQDLRDIASSASNPLPVILSSQHIYEVEAIADSILFLDKGEVVFSGALEKLYQERQERTYEFTSPADKTKILEQLDPLGVLEVEHAGLTYLVSVPSEVSGRRLLDCLFAADIEIRYFRDISNSSRKLFKGRGE
jgi:ABC-type multidrug transport system ATPase subunit